MEVSQGWLGGVERSQSGLGPYLQASLTRLSPTPLTKEGSELRHKLIPLLVRSVVAEVNQRTWVCQKVPLTLGTQA